MLQVKSKNNENRITTKDTIMEPIKSIPIATFAELILNNYDPKHDLVLYHHFVPRFL